MKASGRARQFADAAGKTPMRQVWIALILSLAGSAVVGGGLVLALDNIWWLVGGSAVSLVGGAIYLGRSIAEPEPLYGTLLAAIYVTLVIVVVFAGTIFAVFPDPLPGLDMGDSTFFFVSPLILLVSGVLGSVVGGRLCGGRSNSDE